MRSIERAGAAAVQVCLNSGRVLADISGPIFAPLQQTAPAAEAHALTVVAGNAAAPHAVYSDCAAVVGAAADRAAAARASSVLGGL